MNSEGNEEDDDDKIFDNIKVSNVLEYCLRTNFIKGCHKDR
jgi:hypothetical protein